ARLSFHGALRDEGLPAYQLRRCQLHAGAEGRRGDGAPVCRHAGPLVGARNRGIDGCRVRGTRTTRERPRRLAGGAHRPRRLPGLRTGAGVSAVPRGCFAFAAVVVFAGFGVRGFTGFGAVMAAIPLLALRMPLKQAVALLAVLSLVNGFWLVADAWAHVP